jgi:hypothetical protein
MDQEMNFPNPVVRTDLPTKKPRWPKVLIAAAVLLVLGIIFFPQILSSKVGRKFVVSYLASKTNSAVTVESIKTSWFGGTEVRFLMIKDPLGRRISVSNLQCDASLWGLLRGKYKLGDTDVNGLFMDYVIDDGRGVDTLERMNPKPPAPQGADGAPVLTRLPVLSGNIKIHNATVVLWRGTVQPRLYDVVWQQARLDNVSGVLDIPALDKAWSYTLSASVPEENEQAGTISSSGTVDLGENGILDTSQMKVDLTVTGANVRTGPLGAALIPTATPDEVRQVFGPVLNELKLAMTASDGRLHFQTFEGTGPGAQFKIGPSIDTTSIPPTMTLIAPGAISMGVSKRLANEWLVYLNPFFREAADGQGRVSLVLESFRLPLAQRAARTMTAKGQIIAKAVALNRQDEMTAGEALPKNLASQVSLLTGGTDATVPLDASGPFSITGGEIAIGPMATSVRDFAFVLEGTVDAETGTLNLTASPTNGSLAAKIPAMESAAVAIPIAGTVRQPQLGVLSMKGSLSDSAVKAVAVQVNEQITRMKSKETQRLLQKSQMQVDEILRPLQGPTTATTTAPAGNSKP